MEVLTTAECWRLVEAGHLGRLAVDAPDGRPDVFPLNYLVHNGNLFLRSAPGTKLRSIAQNPAVAFEIDGSDDRHRWSVVIRADAAGMDAESEIEASGVLDLVSWSPTPKSHFIRLVPVSIAGRRFPREMHRTMTQGDPWTALPEPGVASGASTGAAHGKPDAEHGKPDAEHGKPRPIPHYAPLPH